MTIGGEISYCSPEKSGTVDIAPIIPNRRRIQTIKLGCHPRRAIHRAGRGPRCPKHTRSIYIRGLYGGEQTQRHALHRRYR
jgi:hypothetical protein